MRILLVLVSLSLHVFGQLAYDRPVDWNLPDPAQKCMEASHIFDRFSLSDRVNPFYLRGDFDGDGQQDYAVLVTDQKSKKSAMVICLSSHKSADVLGKSGRMIRVGTKSDGYDLEDFDWMDAWQVHPRIAPIPSELNDASTVGKMVGEGIRVERTEAASALVYWDGTNFRWYQLSD